MALFSLLIGLGAALGVWQVARCAPPRETGRWVDAALISLLLALLGARAVYVALEGSYYAAHPLEIFQVGLGGLAWPGAALGWLVSVLLVALLWRIPLGAAADGLAHLLAPLAIGTWLGCWQSGCAYAAALPPGAWWGIPAPDESGLLASRFPLQPLAALLILAHEWAMSSFLNLPKDGGLRAALTLAALGLVISIASLLWAQPTRRVGVVPLDCWFALGMGVVGVLYGLWVELFKPKTIMDQK